MGTYNHEYYLEHKERYKRNRQKFRKENPDAEREIRRKNYLKNIEKRRAYSRAYMREYVKTHPYIKGTWKKTKKRFSSKRHGAMKRGIDFTLGFEKFKILIEQDCHYCGRENPTKGLDRKDNSKGYTLENTVPCCWDCNDAKGTHSKPEFILMSTLIADRFKAGVI